MKKRATSRKVNIKRYYLSYFLKIAALSLLYYATARFGLALDAISRFATLVWIPSGISVSSLLLFGSALWPGIALGAFLANLANGAPLPVAMGIGAGNALEAITCVYLLRRKGFKNTFHPVRDVYLFILTAVPLGAGISATIGVTSLFLGGLVSLSAYYMTWIAWVLGDIISILVITPFILTWKAIPRTKISLKRVIEGAALAALLFATGTIVFFSTNVDYPVTYLVFLPLIWASFRFGQHGATALILTLSTMAILGTVLGLTPFSKGRLSDELLSVQSFMGIITGTSLILAAIVAERRELGQRKDEFIAIASHELKTPVTSIKLHTQLLHQKFLKVKDIKSAETVAKMDGQIDKLVALINELLDVTKIEEGKLKFNIESFDLNRLTSEIVGEMQLTTKHKIEKKLDKIEAVYADRERIGQVLTNLISNAIKYSPGANRIVVRTYKDRKNVGISVQDFGMGLTSKDREKVFDRFNRAGQEGVGGLPGLGLGLYISKEIVKRHKGKIWLKSTKGKGSTFYFSLPLNSNKNSS